MRMAMQQLNELDLKTMGQWPTPVKAVVAVILAAIVGLLMYNLMISDQWATLEREEEREVELKEEYGRK